MWYFIHCLGSTLEKDTKRDFKTEAPTFRMHEKLILSIGKILPTPMHWIERNDFITSQFKIIWMPD